MTVVTFDGVVSAQTAAGETVTIEVFIAAQPDPILTTTGTTDDTGKYIATADIAAGSYTAKATVLEDAGYLQAESPLVSFDVTKTTRTITLNVTVP